jgi:transposase-like protein
MSGPPRRRWTAEEKLQILEEARQAGGEKPHATGWNRRHEHQGQEGRPLSSRRSTEETARAIARAYAAYLLERDRPRGGDRERLTRRLAVDPS